MSVVSMVSGAAVNASTFVKVSNAASGTVAQCSASTDQPIGVANVGAASGGVVPVVMSGSVCDLVAGTGGWSSGVLLKTDSNGNGVPVASSSDIAGAIALTAALAGEARPVLVLSPSGSPLGGSGTPVTLGGNQTITGVKTFSGTNGAVKIDTAQADFPLPTVLTTGGTAQLTIQPLTGQFLFVGGFATPNYAAASLYVRPQSGVGALDCFAVETPSGAAGSNACLFRIDAAGHLITANSSTGGIAPTPTIGAGAGVGATVTIAGSTTAKGTDTNGIITVTGAGTPAAGVLATVAFSTAFAAAPKSVILTPANAAAAALAVGAGGVAIWANTLLTTGWTLNAGAAIATATAYSWYYLVIG